MDSIISANRKVNRAIAASAAGMGAKVRIHDNSGYWPRWNDRNMMPVFKKAMEEVLTSVDCRPEEWNAGCSDMGDMASLMPTIQAYVGGACGIEHGKDYRIEDVDSACVDSAKVQLIAIRLFLENNAKNALNAVTSYKPYFKSKEEYFEFVDKLNNEYDAVIYDESGNVTLNLG